MIKLEFNIQEESGSVHFWGSGGSEGLTKREMDFAKRFLIYVDQFDRDDPETITVDNVPMTFIEGKRKKSGTGKS